METLILGTILFGLLALVSIASLVYTTPILHLMPYCVLAVLNAIFAGVNSLHTLMLVAWLALFLLITIFSAKSGMEMKDWRVTFDGSFRSKTMQRWRFAVFALGFLLAAAFWISQSGADDFSSQKRLGSSDDLYNFANFLTGAYILFPIYIFGLKSVGQKIAYHYKVFAMIILGWTFVQGYLSSSRATFFFTFLMIIIFRVCQQPQVASRLRVAFLGSLVLLAQIPILAQIAEERANRDGEGYEILYEQAFGSDSGYGFAVSKDEAVYDFVRANGPAMDPTYMLGGVYGLFPRVWWENKPTYVDSGPIAGALVFRDERWVTPGAAIPISFPAEMAFAFGTNAFWVGLVLYGFVAAGACLAIKKWPMLLVPLSLLITQLAGGGLPKSVAVFIINFVAVLFLTRFVGLRIVRISRSGNHSGAMRNKKPLVFHGKLRARTQ